MSRHTTVEVVVEASRAEVWRALRDPERLTAWFGWDYDGLDAEVRMIFLEDVEADEDGGTLTMAGGDRYEVEDRGDGQALLRLTRAAAPDGFDEVEEGWIAFTEQLRFAVGCHPGEPRRTVHRSWDAGGEEPPAAPAGEEWYRSEHQEGKRVPDLGDALFVRMANPGGGGRLIISAYAADEAVLASLVKSYG